MLARTNCIKHLGFSSGWFACTSMLDECTHKLYTLSVTYTRDDQRDCNITWLPPNTHHSTKCWYGLGSCSKSKCLRHCLFSTTSRWFVLQLESELFLYNLFQAINVGWMVNSNMTWGQQRFGCGYVCNVCSVIVVISNYLSPHSFSL